MLWFISLVLLVTKVIDVQFNILIRELGHKSNMFIQPLNPSSSWKPNHLHISTILLFLVYSITEWFEVAIKLTCLKCKLEAEIHLKKMQNTKIASVPNRKRERYISLEIPIYMPLEWRWYICTQILIRSQIFLIWTWNE